MVYRQNIIIVNRNPQDVLNLLSKLTVKKSFNALKVLSSYYYSRASALPSQWGMPVSISIEPTTSCNLRCPECPTGLRSFSPPTRMMKKALFESVINQLAPSLSYLIFYFHYEPYLTPHLLGMIQIASQKKIYTATSTNAPY